MSDEHAEVAPPIRIATEHISQTDITEKLHAEEQAWAKLHLEQQELQSRHARNAVQMERHSAVILAIREILGIQADAPIEVDGGSSQ